MNDTSDSPTDTTATRPDEPTIAGLPRRQVVAATLASLVVALCVGALIVLSGDGGGGEQPETIGSGGGGFALTPDDTDVLGAPVAVDYETFEGDSRNTGPMVGRPLVLNFFAEWCPPCVAEMPDFEAVHQAVGDDVGFLGLSYLESAELGMSVVELTGVTYEVGRDPDGEAYEVFGGIQMPTTVFIDEAGTVLEVYNGALTESQLRDRIDRHFGISEP